VVALRTVSILSLTVKTKPQTRRSARHPEGGRKTSLTIERAYVDKRYRSHNAQYPRRVFISGQKRGVFGAIKRELRRRSAIEPVIGHMKTEGHLGRCYLKGRAGDAANAILSAVGHNFRRNAWLRIFLALILASTSPLMSARLTLNPAF